MWTVTAIHRTVENRLMSSNRGKLLGQLLKFAPVNSIRRKVPSSQVRAASRWIHTEHTYNVKLTKEDCEKILCSKLGNRSIEVKDFNMHYFMELMGFHGTYGGLKINAVVDGKPMGTRFFVKTSTNNPIIKEKYWDTHQQPYKEFVFLTQVHKELQPFVRKKITAECHLGRLGEVIVLDDLCEFGYVGMRPQYCDVSHAETGLVALASLHAATIVCEEKTGVCIPEKYKNIAYESLLSEYPDRPHLLKSADTGLRLLGAAHFTNIIPLEDQGAFFSKVRSTVMGMHQKYPTKFRKVVCQGDPNKNNLLFKYGNGETVIDGILVDFGVTRFAPPAMEVMQYLHLNSTTEFRLKHATRLKDAYYNALCSMCAESGIDTSLALPREQFDEACDYYEAWGICTRVYYEYVIRLPPEQLFQLVADIEKFLNLMIRGNPELSMEAFSKSEAYRKAISEAVECAVHFFSDVK